MPGEPAIGKGELRVFLEAIGDSVRILPRLLERIRYVLQPGRDV